MKITQRHQNDFATYIRWRDECSDFCPQTFIVPLISAAKSPQTVLEAFVEYDTHGKLTRPLQRLEDAEPLRKAVEGKASLNLHIKMWVEGYEDCGGVFWLESELMPEYHWLPSWVWKAVQNQWALKVR